MKVFTLLIFLFSISTYTANPVLLSQAETLSPSKLEKMDWFLIYPWTIKSKIITLDLRQI